MTERHESSWFRVVAFLVGVAAIWAGLSGLASAVFGGAGVVTAVALFGGVIVGMVATNYALDRWAP